MSRKVSIITVVRNNINGLIKTYESIKSSLSNEVEWVVIDGASEDGAVIFLSQLNNENVQWLSEPDKSMYNAMNKGITLSHAKYLQFLNAGDVLEIRLQDSFLKCVNMNDLIFYNIKKIDTNNRMINWNLPTNFIEHLKSYASVPHQSTFIKKKVFEDIGVYREDYKYLGDYEFFCRAFNTPGYIPTTSFFLETTLVSFICDGITFNYRLSLRLLKESARIQKHYYNHIDKKTYLMYTGKYLASFLPYTLRIAGLLRRFIKH